MALSFAMLLGGCIVVVGQATRLTLTLMRRRRPARRQYAYLALGAILMMIAVWTLPPPPELMFR